MKIGSVFALLLIPAFVFCSCVEKKTKRKEVKEFYPDGKLRAKYEVINGSIKDGYYKEFSINGKLSYEGCYHLGLLNGKQSDFYANGKLYEVTYYSNGVLDSGKGFDSLGNFTNNIWPIETKAKSDTIHEGEDYKATINLKGIRGFRKGEIRINYLAAKRYDDWKAGNIPAPMMKDSFYNGYKFNKEFDSIGNYVIDGVVTYYEMNGSPNGSVFKCEVIVLPNPKAKKSNHNDTRWKYETWFDKNK